jgi:hypothetical protein
MDNIPAAYEPARLLLTRFKIGYNGLGVPVRFQVFPRLHFTLVVHVILFIDLLATL